MLVDLLALDISNLPKIDFTQLEQWNTILTIANVFDKYRIVSVRSEFVTFKIQISDYDLSNFLDLPKFPKNESCAVGNKVELSNTCLPKIACMQIYNCSMTEFFKFCIYRVDHIK